jgi:hypothetical protein
MLFTLRSLLTMAHGLVLSGGAMLGLAVALYALHVDATPSGGLVRERSAEWLARLSQMTSVLLWMAVLSGTYVVFPLYRATPPEGLVALDAFPRALLMSDPSTRWLHSFAMEIKEHMPWIAAMLTTAAAFLATRYRETLLAHGQLRRLTASLLWTSLVLVALVALLGVFVNKIAPVQ